MKRGIYLRMRSGAFQTQREGLGCYDTFGMGEEMAA